MSRRPKPSSAPVYDRIGLAYARHRRPDPTIAAAIERALAGARTVVSVGAGTGSYEPAGAAVIAVEPSMVMIGQRGVGTAPAVRAMAEALPFPPGSFDAAMAILTIHHWSRPEDGLDELRRVARRQVVLTFDPEAHSRHWLVDYVPELEAFFRSAPSVKAVADRLLARRVVPVPIAHDTPDGMTVAYWRRPEAYLQPDRRKGGSALQQVDQRALAAGLARLADDLASGQWHARYGALLSRETMDYGLRLVVS